jgi:hypothetical protein
MIGRMWISDLEVKEEILTDILLSNIISRAVSVLNGNAPSLLYVIGFIHS